MRLIRSQGTLRRYPHSSKKKPYAIWDTGRRTLMLIALIMAVVALKSQWSSLQSVEFYKKKPEVSPSSQTIRNAAFATFAGVIGFGPPISPAWVTIGSWFAILVVKGQLPGFIPEIEGMAVSLILAGLSIGYFIDGIRRARKTR